MSEKLPRGAKRLGERIVTAEEKKRLYVPRAQYVPIAEVVSVDDEKLTAAEGRKQLLADLWVCWNQTAQAMNWMLSQLFANDGPLEKTEKGWRLPKFKPPRPGDESLYLGTRKIAPDISSGSVSSLAQEASSNYNRDRWPVRILMNQSLRTYRAPQPLPIREQDYTLNRDEHGRTLLSIPVRGRRWVVRLRAGAEFRRQMAAIESVLAGNGWLGALKITWGNHGDIMVAISTFVPKRDAAGASRVMIVRTRADKLWGVWTDDREHAWKLHEDQILRLLTAQRIASHAEELHRLADDSKAERRSPKQERSRI